MNNNKIIVIGTVLALGLFLTVGCINGEEEVDDNGTLPQDQEENETTPVEENETEENQTEEEVPPGEAVETCQQLQDIRNDLSGQYYLANDIDCSDTENWNGGKGFEPIGSSEEPFKGTLNGNGKVIKDLHIDRNTSEVGLFAFAGEKADIHSLGIENMTIKGMKKVGGIAGMLSGNISECYTTGNVRLTVKKAGKAWPTGGIVGYNYKGRISDSYTTASVIGMKRVGGLVGWSNRGNVVNCYAAGEVRGDQSGTNQVVGGLIGVSESEVSGSFWDEDSTGMEVSDGGQAATTSGMKSESTFSVAGWDFQETWYMDGYPHLQWEK